jgi:hypothetical protein
VKADKETFLHPIPPHIFAKCSTQEYAPLGGCGKYISAQRRGGLKMKKTRHSEKQIIAELQQMETPFSPPMPITTTL